MAEMFPVAGKQYVVRNPTTGDMQLLPVDAAHQAVADGMEPATPEQINEYNLAQRRGTPGQVALGLAETGVRAISAGQVPALSSDVEAARERAQYNEKEHPVLDTAAQVLPGAAAAVAAGGASLPVAGAAAAQGAIAGMANLGAAQEQAFRADETLSAEAGWSAFGSGVLLGAATELGGAALARGAGAVRNRFVEAATSASRKAEAEAFERAGIVRPAKGLARSAEDPVAAAEFRGKATAARAEAAPELQSILEHADAAQQAVAHATPSGLELEDAVVGDVARQRHLVRDVVIGLRDDLTQAGEQASGLASQAMEALDNANSSGQVYDMLLRVRGTLKNALDKTDSPAMARVLEKYEKQAGQLAESKTAWGAPAEDTADRNAALGAVADARASLDKALSEGDYLSSVGTAGGKAVDDAMDVYSERLGAVLKQSDSAEARQGIEALQRLKALRDGPMSHIATGNQLDALASTTVPKDGPKGSGMAGDILGELGETAVESVLPGAGLVRKAWKYRRQIARLAGAARDTTESTASALLKSPARSAERALTSKVPNAIGATVRGAARAGASDPYFASIDSDPEKAYARVKGAVQMLADNPDRLMEHLAGNMGDLPTEAPDLFQHIAVQSQRAVEFLKAHIPPAFGFSMLYPDGPPPSRMDIIELSLYWSGATDGKGTMQRIGAQKAMPEEVEAFQYVFKEWFAQLQERTVIKAQEMAREGHALGAFQIANMENTLDLAGQLDPTFSTSVAQIYQTADAIHTQTMADSTARGAPSKAGQRISEKGVG